MSWVQLRESQVELGTQIPLGDEQIHQTDRKWMVPPFSKFYGKIWDGFYLNDNNRENSWFTEFSTKIQGWLSLTFFICLNNQLSSFNSIIVQISEKRNSSNRQQKWVVASFSNFHGKIWFGFCLNIRKQFFLGFLF